MKCVHLGTYKSQLLGPCVWYDLSVPFMITSPQFRQMVFSFRSQMYENSLCTKQLTLDNKRKMHIKVYSILKHLNLLVNKHPFYIIELVSEFLVAERRQHMAIDSFIHLVLLNCTHKPILVYAKLVKKGPLIDNIVFVPQNTCCF